MVQLPRPSFSLLSVSCRLCLPECRLQKNSPLPFSLPIWGVLSRLACLFLFSCAFSRASSVVTSGPFYFNCNFHCRLSTWSIPCWTVFARSSSSFLALLYFLSFLYIVSYYYYITLHTVCSLSDLLLLLYFSVFFVYTLHSPLLVQCRLYFSRNRLCGSAALESKWIFSFIFTRRAHHFCATFAKLFRFPFVSV